MIEAHRYRTSQGKSLYYQVYGPPTGEPVILLHGLASNGRIWGSQIAALKSHYRVYVLDYPGHGRSDPIPNYRIEKLSTLLGEWIDALNLDQVHLVGLSLGCAVALGYAIDHPHRVKSLFLEAPFGGIYPWYRLNRIKLTALVITYLTAMWICHRLFGQRKVVKWANQFGIQTKGYHPLLVSVQCEADPKAVQQLTWQLISPPYVRLLPRLKTPIPAQIVIGEHDSTPIEYIHFIQQILDCPIVRLPDCRHVVQFDDMPGFNALLVAFLDEVCAKQDKLPQGG